MGGWSQCKSLGFLMRQATDVKKLLSLAKRCFKKFMSRVGEVGHDLSCSPQCPRGVQVLEGQQFSADHIFGSSSSVHHDDDKEEVKLDSIMALQMCIFISFGKFELLQLLQENKSSAEPFGEAANVQLPFEVLASLPLKSTNTSTVCRAL